jgi:hypothetical protein
VLRDKPCAASSRLAVAYKVASGVPDLARRVSPHHRLYFHDTGCQGGSRERTVEPFGLSDWIVGVPIG